MPAELLHRWPPPDPFGGGDRMPAQRAHLTSALAVAPDGGWLLSGGDREGPVQIWDIASGTIRTTLIGHTGRLWTAAIAPDASWVATAAYDQKVLVWDPLSGANKLRPKGPTEEYVVVWSMAMAPDGSWLAGSDNYGTIWLWDTRTWAVRDTLTGHHTGVAPVAVGPDGSWLIAGDSTGQLFIRDTTSWRVRLAWPAHDRYIWAIAVAPDGTWFATAGQDQVIHLWEVATLERRATLSGHTDGISSLAIAPDGSWLASCGHDGTVRIWDPGTRSEVASVRQAGKVYTLAGLPDGRGLAVGGEHGLFLYDVEIT